MSSKTVNLVMVVVHCQTRGKLYHTTSFDAWVLGPKKRAWENKEVVSAVLQKLFERIGEKARNRLRNPDHNLINWQVKWTEAVIAEAETKLQNQKRTLGKKGFTVNLSRGGNSYPNDVAQHVFAVDIGKRFELRN